VRLRAAEARASAQAVGAIVHAALADDLAIFYEPGLLARVAAVLREVKPDILLIPSPQDYMEDHANTCRLAVTAAFAHGMRNFPTDPPRPAWDGNVALYHALPHGLRNGLGHLIRPERYVDTGPVLARKRAVLAKHETQKGWLDVSQGMDSYLLEMEALSQQVGKMSGKFAHAEGWRRHSHLGFCPPSFDPLQEALGVACWVDPAYVP